MKKLLLFLLIPFASFSQGRVFQRCGTPTTLPTGFTASRDVVIDTCGGKTYNYTASKWVENLGLKRTWGGKDGVNGTNGTNGICPPCSGGTMSFPFIVVVGTGNDDAQVNQAIADNRTTGKTIYLIGTIVTNEISVPRDNFKLSISGYGATWQLRSGAALLKRTLPTDNSDANIYIIARQIIEGVSFVGNTSAVCLDLGASYMSAYRDLKFDSFNEAIHLRFALRTTVQNCEAVNCISPFWADKGNWTGADNANSQSNQTTFEQCRAYMPSNGQNAFAIYAASGCVVRDCVIEGFVVLNGIDFDGQNSNVVKDFTVENVHFECVNGSTNSFIKLRLAGGTVTINKVFGQYGSVFLDAYSTSGLGFVQISNVPWWVGKAGKFFTTSNVSLDFKYNEAFRGISSTMWNGTAPALCGGGGCGYNKYTVTDIPR